MWDEIQDMPGEIFDMSDEDREEFARVCMMNEEEFMMEMFPEQFNFAWIYNEHHTGNVSRTAGRFLCCEC